MKPTQEALNAMTLGLNLQLLRWNAFKNQYAELKTSIMKDLIALDIEIILPHSVNDFDTDRIFEVADQILGKRRSNIGGDVFSRTFLHFGYIPLALIASAAFKSADYDFYLEAFVSILTDFEIEGNIESLKKIIDLETLWLSQQAEQSGDETINSRDILKASTRLVNRVMTLWEIATKSDIPVQFEHSPFFSVFISYNENDVTFSQQLYKSLKEAGLRTWYAQESMRPGEKIKEQVHAAIEHHDKILLILSESSMKSEWVRTELSSAIKREKTENIQMLFPVRLGSYEELKSWTLFDSDSGRDLAKEVREYFIPDFSDWKEEDKFNMKVRELVKALRIPQITQQ